MFNKICVIGLGYIGLPTAAMFSKNQVNVVGVDISETIIDTINSGKIHITEPGLDKMVQESVSNGYLKAKLKPEVADAFLIAVPTPFKKESDIPKPDISYVEAAVRSISSFIKDGDLIVLESTSPVGTTDRILNILKDLRKDLFSDDATQKLKVNIAHCPERVLPGKAIHELVYNDRVIGGLTNECSKKAELLYKIFVKGECILTNARTAEMAKLTENSSRDVQIAFANELSLICDELDINVWELIDVANRHPRVNILKPGPGVGGHCIAVDPWFLISDHKDKSKLMHSARRVNIYKERWVVEKIKNAIKEIQKLPNEISVACFGLSFKANVDDMRESPALRIYQEVKKFHEGDVIAVEPNISGIIEHPEILFMSTNDALSNADILVLLVDHEEFYGLNLPDKKKVIDTRGIWSE